jgi:hypothetical protein
VPACEHDALARFLLVLSLVALTFALCAVSAAAADPPEPKNFKMSAVTVMPGTTVSLHWSKDPNQVFLLRSTPPRTLPGFSSPTTVSFPSPGGTWVATYEWWATPATAVKVAIPSTAAGGTEYALQLITCAYLGGPCSTTESEVVLTVAGSNWTKKSYVADFQHLTAAGGVTDGYPIDVTVAPDGSIWTDNEGGTGTAGLPAGSSTLANYVNPTVVSTNPFARCNTASPPVCTPWPASQLGERVISAYGKIWFTQGGLYAGGPMSCAGTCPPNHSVIVAFDPTTHHFCTYQVPGDNNEVIGLAAVPADGLLWFTEGATGYITAFRPSAVGNGCPGTADASYSLDGHAFRIPWSGGTQPAHIAVDPASPYLWVTNFWGWSVSRFDRTNGRVTNYPIVSHNSYAPWFIGPGPWQVHATAGYVYVINHFDSTLVRLNKSTGKTNYVPLPLTSDHENGYGLAYANGRLYFSLYGGLEWGDTTAIGYVDIASWEAASAQCSPGVDCAPSPTSAVIYTGLQEATDNMSSCPGPSSSGPGPSCPSFTGIATGPGGTLAIANLWRSKIVRLSP